MNPDLRQRAITALALAIPTMAVVLAGPTWSLALLFGLFAVVGAGEWMAMLQPDRPALSVGYALLTVLLMVAFYAFGPHSPINSVMVGVGGLWWCIAVIWLQRFQSSQWMPRMNLPLCMLIGWLLLLPGWMALVLLRDGDRTIVMLVLVLVWIADGGAYFGGRRWGRLRLASRISPGKTWEGAISGLIAGGLLMYLAQRSGVAPPVTALAWLLLAVATIAASIVGDLFESLIKRHSGVKDSSTLLPGHGGMLDRIDSLTAAAPVFLCGLWFLRAVG